MSTAEVRITSLFIRSFIQAISKRLFKSICTQRRFEHSTDTVSEFHAKATASEELAQGPYVAASAGFEPTKLRTKGDESTNEPPRLRRLASSDDYKDLEALILRDQFLNPFSDSYGNTGYS